VLGSDKARDALKFPAELSIKNLSEYVLLPKSETVFKFCKISSWFDSASIRVATKDKEYRQIFPVVKTVQEDGLNPKDFEPIQCVICVEFTDGKEKRFTFELTPRRYLVQTKEEEPKNIPMVELMVKRVKP
jgi:hypothetical protein